MLIHPHFSMLCPSSRDRHGTQPRHFSKIESILSEVLLATSKDLFSLFKCWTLCLSVRGAPLRQGILFFGIRLVRNILVFCLVRRPYFLLGVPTRCSRSSLPPQSAASSEAIPVLVFQELAGTAHLDVLRELQATSEAKVLLAIDSYNELFQPSSWYYGDNKVRCSIAPTASERLCVFGTPCSTRSWMVKSRGWLGRTH